MAKSPLATTDALHRRAEELDALDAILPFDRRDQLAELLTDDDVATLKHLAGAGGITSEIRGPSPLVIR